MAIEERISKNGLHYLGSTTTLHGDLKGLIFLHGNCSRASEYTPFLSNLSQAYSSHLFIAPYLPGHGSTPTIVCPEPTVPAFATLVLDLIEELGYTRIVLCGHSMSTRIMISAFNIVQTSHPGLVTGLIFLDGSNAQMRNAQRLTSEQAQPVAPSIEQSFREMFPETTPRSFVKEAVQHIKTRDMPYIRALRDSYFQWDLDDSEPELKTIGTHKLPVLLLQSTDVDSENRRRSLKQGERTTYMEHISSLVPQTELVVVEHAGHFLHVDQSEKVNSLLLDFYRSIDAPADALNVIVGMGP